MADTRSSVHQAPPVLSVQGLTCQYKTAENLVTATYRVSFTVNRGDRYIILGPSGCGKSTLLKAVAGFLSPAEGQIALNGIDVVRPAPDRMMVFQDFDQLLPWKTVKQNIMFPMLRTGRFGKREASGTCCPMSMVSNKQSEADYGATSAKRPASVPLPIVQQLSFWERLQRKDVFRRGAILVIVAGIWEGYARWLEPHRSAVGNAALSLTRKRRNSEDDT